MNRVFKTLVWLAAVAAMLACAPRAGAQSDGGRLTQFYEVPTLYNPAAVGSSELLRMRVAGRLQWLGIDNAPQTFLLAADTKLKLMNKWFGAGVNASLDKAGLYTTIMFNAQVAFKFRLAGGQMTIGVQPGMANVKFRGSEVFIPDDDSFHSSSDEAIPTNDVGGSAFDLGAGVWYARPAWHAGVGLLHAMQPTVKFTATGSTSTPSQEGEDAKQFCMQLNRTLYFQAGGNIRLGSTLFELAPELLVWSDFTFYGGEAMARVRYNKVVTAGVGYRWDDAVCFTIGAEIKGFFIGYSFDWALSDLSRASYGSHEIVAGYSMKLDFSEKNRNRHKSIRLM